MSTHLHPIAELTHRAKNTLINELGAVDTLRFLNQLAAGHGDYTKDRVELFKQDTVKAWWQTSKLGEKVERNLFAMSRFSRSSTKIGNRLLPR